MEDLHFFISIIAKLKNKQLSSIIQKLSALGSVAIKLSAIGFPREFLPDSLHSPYHFYFN